MVPAGFFRVSLPDKAIFIKILITNGKQLRLKLWGTERNVY